MLRRLFATRKGKPQGPTLDPRLPDGLRVYAVGDIHGRADLLRALLEKIASDARDAPAKKERLVYLGDYIDRGHESRQVIDVLLEGPPPGFEAIYLKGNHEETLLNFLQAPDFGYEWQHYGGLETLASYGVTGLGARLTSEDFNQARDQFEEALPESHFAFFQALELSACFGDYFFAHAGVRPGVSLENQLSEDLLWIRAEFTRWRGSFGKVVVHGHSVTEEPELEPNRIGIDTGAYLTHRLTSVVLEGAEQRFLQTDGAQQPIPAS